MTARGTICKRIRWSDQAIFFQACWKLDLYVSSMARSSRARWLLVSESQLWRDLSIIYRARNVLLPWEILQVPGRPDVQPNSADARPKKDPKETKQQCIVLPGLLPAAQRRRRGWPCSLRALGRRQTPATDRPAGARAVRPQQLNLTCGMSSYLCLAHVFVFVWRQIHCSTKQGVLLSLLKHRTSASQTASTVLEWGVWHEITGTCRSSLAAI